MQRLWFLAFETRESDEREREDVADVEEAARGDQHADPQVPAPHEACARTNRGAACVQVRDAGIDAENAVGNGAVRQERENEWQGRR
eukprot:2945249-Rhodomonas_salina.1